MNETLVVQLLAIFVIGILIYGAVRGVMEWKRRRLVRRPYRPRKPRKKPPEPPQHDGGFVA